MALDFFQAYATDPKAEEEGREFDMGGGVKFLIARSYNSKYTRMLNKQYEANKHTLDLKDTPEQVAACEACSIKIMAYVMARSILLGWSGDFRWKGQPLPYSVANAEMVLSLKEGQREVGKRADDFRNFRIETENADAKNSETTSPGTSSGVNTSSTFEA